MSKLDNFQRLTILLQISQLSGRPDMFVDPELVGALIASGDEWALHWEYDFFQKEEHPLNDAVKETSDIFDMYRALQNSVRQLDEKDSKELAGAVKFEGFDGNNDVHYHIARVIVEHLKRYDDLVGATDNSHSRASLDRYRTQFARYRAILDRSRDLETFTRALTKDEVKEIIG